MAAKSDGRQTGAPRWTYIFGALVVVAFLIWVIFFSRFSWPEPQPTQPSVQISDPPPAPPSVQRTQPPAAALPVQRAEAHGGTAINASGNAQVSVGAVPALEAAKPVVIDTPPSEPAVHPAQDAKAGPGGRAINASGDAKVKVETPAQPQP